MIGHDDTDGFAPWYDEGSPSIGGLASRQGVTHVASVAELAQPDPFESDEEYEEFSRPLRLPASRTRLTAVVVVRSRPASCSDRTAQSDGSNRDHPRPLIARTMPPRLNPDVSQT